MQTLFKMKNKTINYIDLIQRNKQIDELKRKGFVIIPKRKFKLIGYIFIGVGVVTIPIPFITIPLLLIGFTFLGLSYQNVLDRLRKKFKLFLWGLRR